MYPFAFYQTKLSELCCHDQDKVWINLYLSWSSDRAYYLDFSNSSTKGPTLLHWDIYLNRVFLVRLKPPAWLVSIKSKSKPYNAFVFSKKSIQIIISTARFMWKLP